MKIISTKTVRRAYEMFAQVYLVHPVADKYTSSVLVAVKPRAVAFLKRLGAHHQIQKVGLKSRTSP